MLAAVMEEIDREDETTILLVDDDPDTVRLMELMLTAIPRPYKILKAYDGCQAVESMREIVPDVVFLDFAHAGMCKAS